MVDAHVKSHGFYTTHLKPQNAIAGSCLVIIVTEHTSKVAHVVLQINHVDNEKAYIDLMCTIFDVKMLSKLT